MAGNDAYNVRILYEDNHIICAVKPRGILSQADGTGAPDMLTVLKGYLKEKYRKDGDAYLGLLHRLDRPVGGVMVFARTSKAASRLSEQLRERRVKKTYFAVLRRAPCEPAGRLVNTLFKDPARNIVSVRDLALDANDAAVQNAAPYIMTGGTSGAPNAAPDIAALDYSVITTAPDDGFALVGVDLLTGKPHQIRAQFAHIGCPVVGDRKYGVGPRRAFHAPGLAHTRERETPGPALWAGKLEFFHPVRKTPIAVSAPPPEEYPWNLFNPAALQNWLEINERK